MEATVERALTIEDLKIEKDIPIPVVQNQHAYWTTLFDMMEVNDSVKFPRSVRIAVSVSKGSYKRKTGKVFTIRTLSDKQHFRLWRTE